MTEAGWTSNAPTKEGWYWWQRTENDNPVVVWVNTFHPDKQLRAEMISGRRELLTHFNGLFKGPITPDSYQQGRVAAFKEVEQRFDSMFGATDRRIDSVRDYRIDKFFTWLAQAAQDEKGARDAS